MRYFLFFFLLLHGLIHFLGFAKAFSLASVEQLQLPISKSSGLLWLVAGLLLVLTAILQFRDSSSWPLWAFGAIAISQFLILLSWQDAKWGTIANLVVLVAAVIVFSGHRFEKAFLQDVKEQLSQATSPDLGTEALFRTETVTFFNDMCLLAPAALIDPRIEWEPIDSVSCRAIFTNQGTSISATLYFDEEGQLLNFRSDDRKEINIDQHLPFSTPVSSYQSFGATNQFRLMGDGQAVWHYLDGAFVYGEFHTVEVRYNVGDLYMLN